MRRLGGWMPVLSVLLTAGAGSAACQPKDAGLVAALEAHMKELAAREEFSGAVLLAKDGTALFRGAWGVADRNFDVPNRVDTKFNLGSMNKMFTAVAIAQLVEAGKLSFDDPVSKHLPGVLRDGAGDRIRIAHLLTHSSGLGSYFNEEWGGASRARYRTVDDYMQLVARETLQFEPGTRSAYSNSGFMVLGKIVEAVSGQSYFDYVRTNIYARAGMVDTDAYDLDAVTKNLAVGYEKERTATGTAWRNNIFMHVIRGGPAGGGYSTVDDLLRFDAALRAGTLVGKRYVDLLLSPKPALHSPTYGYGFGTGADGAVVGHGGGFPGINAKLDMYLRTGYTVVVLSNMGRAAEPVAAWLRERLP